MTCAHQRQCFERLHTHCLRAFGSPMHGKVRIGVHLPHLLADLPAHTVIFSGVSGFCCGATGLIIEQGMIILTNSDHCMSVQGLSPGFHACCKRQSCSRCGHKYYHISVEQSYLIELCADFQASCRQLPCGVKLCQHGWMTCTETEPFRYQAGLY